MNRRLLERKWFMRSLPVDRVDKYETTPNRTTASKTAKKLKCNTFTLTRSHAVVATNTNPNGFANT
jgi:hypothetical protein